VDRFCITVFSLVCIISIAIAPAVADDKTPITLSVDSPRNLGTRGFLLTTGWNLTFKLEVKSAVALVGQPESSSLGRTAFVIRDPDNCLHMGSFFNTDEPYEECSELTEDELWILYNDFDRCSALRDDPFDPNEEFLNKPYLVVAPYPGFNGSGNIQPVLQGVGPTTDSSFGSDCVGYGVGLLPGLVVMANIGAARVFDINFERPKFPPFGAAIRNMGGFFNELDIEPLGQNNRSVILAQMDVHNHFEPIVLLDGSLADNAGESLARLDSGPIVFSPFPAGPFTAGLITEVTVRAVVVLGAGPDFIIDMDGNDEFTANDLELSGFTLLSNEVQLDVVTQLSTFTGFPIGTDPNGECRLFTEDGDLPPNPFAYLSDLDDNGEAGRALCSAGSAARTGVRIRR